MKKRKLHQSFIMALFLSTISSCEETTHEYLQNTVRTLRNLKQFQTLRRADVAEVTETIAKAKAHKRSHQYSDDVPPLTLTKGELAALYEQAVSKGETLKLDVGDNEYVHAVVHQLDEETPSETQYSSHQHQPNEEHHEGPPEAVNEDAGFYYYYYPIKSFLDEITSQPTDGPSASYHTKPSHHHHHHHKELTTYKPPFAYHSHHHQHNVTIQTADHEKKDAKQMEPLFMAISGFIGMAVMFMLSMVVFPKFGLKPKLVNDIKKKEKLDDFARFALNAIEGHCAERFACELTKTARSFDMEDNRFYKLLMRMAPGTFGRYMNDAGRYANKQLQCTAIPCTKRKPNNNNKRPPVNPPQKKKTANKKH